MCNLTNLIRLPNFIPFGGYIFSFFVDFRKFLFFYELHSSLIGCSYEFG